MAKNLKSFSFRKEVVMQNNNDKKISVLLALGFATLLGLLVLLVAFSGQPAQAAPFAYVTNVLDGTVSVVDTATPAVVATIPVGSFPSAVAVTPDGKHVYVANRGTGAVPGAVSVIDTSSNAVVATVPVGINPTGVAITPDGTHAYVTNANLNSGARGTVSVISTATNKVVATIPAGINPFGIAITPDGKRAYVTNEAGTVSVIGYHPGWEIRLRGESVWRCLGHRAEYQHRGG
jgi:YVTN family beta-propeller protein